MSEPASQPATAPDGRPLGPDGKPLPGPQQMQQVMAQRRMAQQQAQVDEVVGIMRNNVEKAGCLDELRIVFILRTNFFTLTNPLKRNTLKPLKLNEIGFRKRF